MIGRPGSLLSAIGFAAVKRTLSKYHRFQIQLTGVIGYET